MFMPHELVRLLAGVGFVDIEACGADGEPFETSSKRLVMYGRRPGEAGAGDGRSRRTC